MLVLVLCCAPLSVRADLGMQLLVAPADMHMCRPGGVRKMDIGSDEGEGVGTLARCL